MTMAKTDAGLKILRDRRSGLSPRQRAALILIDGHRPLEEVLAATATVRDRYLRAYSIATEITAALPRRDSSLALAVEAAGILAELQALASRVRAAVPASKFARLDAALREP